MKAGWMERPLKMKLRNQNQRNKRLEKLVRRWYEKHPLSDEVRHAITGE